MTLLHPNLEFLLSHETISFFLGYIPRAYAIICNISGESTGNYRQICNFIWLNTHLRGASSQNHRTPLVDESDGRTLASHPLRVIEKLSIGRP